MLSVGNGKHFYNFRILTNKFEIKNCLPHDSEILG